MNQETTDEIVDTYRVLRVETTAAMRGMIGTFGIDRAIGEAAAVYGNTLEQIVALEGVLRAAYDAGRLAGVR
jgi:hypothetical protein